MTPRNLKIYGLYLFRWQLSTPILAGVLYLLSFMDVLTATIIANLLGGLVFFWVDRFIFTAKRLEAQREVRDATIHADCGKESGDYRIAGVGICKKPDEANRRLRREQREQYTYRKQNADARAQRCIASASSTDPSAR